MQGIRQGTPEWFAARRGKITASRLGDLMASTKNGPGASHTNYIAELVAEILTGNVADSYTSGPMQWGLDHEQDAIDEYEIRTEELVQRCGFITHPDIPRSGASPDGLVAVHGMVEVKCPNTATHISTLTTWKIKQEYIYQMQWQMVCANRLWCDFVSYDPRLPENVRLFIKRVDLDVELSIRLIQAVTLGLLEVDAIVAKLRDWKP